MTVHVLEQALGLAAGLHEEVADPEFLDGGDLVLGMDVELEFELAAEDGELEEVIVVGLDSSELIQLVQVDHEAVSGHLMDGFVVAHWVVVLSDDAGVRAQRDFWIGRRVHYGI